jgi:hypothetical protein
MQTYSALVDLDMFLIGFLGATFLQIQFISELRSSAFIMPWRGAKKDRQ